MQSSLRQSNNEIVCHVGNVQLTRLLLPKKDMQKNHDNVIINRTLPISVFSLILQYLLLATEALMLKALMLYFEVSESTWSRLGKSSSPD